MWEEIWNDMLGGAGQAGQRKTQSNVYGCSQGRRGGGDGWQVVNSNIQKTCIHCGDPELTEGESYDDFRDQLRVDDL